MTPSRARIEVPIERIDEFCRRHHIHRLALFGSVLRDDFTPDSDVDVLVEFEPGKIPGFAFFSMEEELSGILGRRVDLNTPNSLSKYFREEVFGGSGGSVCPGTMTRCPCATCWITRAKPSPWSDSVPEPTSMATACFSSPSGRSSKS
jgi:uncharacterized protein